MARHPWLAGRAEEDTRRVGRVAWASPPPDIGSHVFNEPSDPGEEMPHRPIRIMEVQPSAYDRGGNMYAQRQQYDATMKARGFGPEEDD